MKQHIRHSSRKTIMQNNQKSLNSNGNYFVEWESIYSKKHKDEEDEKK